MHPIENIIDTSLDKIKHLIDVNTVIGEPIVCEGGTLLLPVSKITIGFAMGGGEYGSAGKKSCASHSESGEEHFPFTGATTAGMSLKPTAFLSVEQGNVRVIPAAPSCTLDKLTDFLPQVLKSIDKLVSSMVDNNAKKCENKGSIHNYRCEVKNEAASETDGAM